MAANSFPANEEQFMEWFWKGNNGNELIHKLNAYSYNEHRRLKSDFIRREKYSPTIYGLALEFVSGAPKWYKTMTQNKGQIKLMKIGFTQKETTPGSDNRMEQVKKTIIRELCGQNGNYDVKVHEVFVLPINFADTTMHSTVEGSIRRKMGVSVPDDLAKMFGLPVPTEWVFTTEKVTRKFISMKEQLKQEYRKKNRHITRVLTTEIFKSPGFSYADYDTPASNLKDNVESLKTAYK